MPAKQTLVSDQTSNSTTLKWGWIFPRDLPEHTESHEAASKIMRRSNGANHSSQRIRADSYSRRVAWSDEV